MAQLGIVTSTDASRAVFDLRTTLEHDGYTPWLHPEPAQALEHPDWLEAELRDMWALIVLLTPETHNNPALCYQYAFARGANVPVIPLLDGDVTPPPPLAACDPLPLDATAAWGTRLRATAQAVNARALALPADAPPPVIEARRQLDSPDPATRSAAITLLAQIKHPAACDLLIAAAHCPTYADVRSAAVIALGATGNPVAIPALVEALGDPVETVTQVAIPQIASFGAAAIPALHAAITGPNRWRRNGAVIALARIDSPDTVPALIDALAVEHWYSSRAAAARLAQIGDARAIPALQAALERNDPHLRTLAERALTALQG